MKAIMLCLSVCHLFTYTDLFFFFFFFFSSVDYEYYYYFLLNKKEYLLNKSDKIVIQITIETNFNRIYLF